MTVTAAPGSCPAQNSPAKSSASVPVEAGDLPDNQMKINIVALRDLKAQAKVMAPFGYAYVSCAAQDEWTMPLRHMRVSERRHRDRHLRPCLFAHFSIGSNDLTQLTLGVVREAEVVGFNFDEPDPEIREMLRLAVTCAKRNHPRVCGEAPANHCQIARLLAALGIDSINVTAASLPRTITVLAEAEQQGAGATLAAH
jgi:PEP-utilising enzyme, PEP-binding domain